MSDEEELVASMTGRSIVRAVYRDENEGEWGDHGTVLIWLDDGRVMRFDSMGHDASGLIIKATRTVDAAACLHCGEPHADCEVNDGWEYGDHLPPTPFAFCADGHHAAWVEAATVKEREHDAHTTER
jgi:hypothetical protein